MRQTKTKLRQTQEANWKLFQLRGMAGYLRLLCFTTPSENLNLLSDCLRKEINATRLANLPASRIISVRSTDYEFDLPADEYLALFTNDEYRPAHETLQTFVRRALDSNRIDVKFPLKIKVL